MKIAIIGAGVSGLVAARRLHDDHSIAVFEAGEKPGGHTNTIRVELDGEMHSVDTGFIVFNEWTYPHFIELLNELGVASQPTQMGFSVRDDLTGLEYAGQNLNSLFAQRRNLLSPRFLRMLADIVRFNRQVLKRFDRLPSAMTVDDFLRAGHYSSAFARQHLLPMGAAIWSCPLGTFSQFPIQFIIEFYRNHGLLNLVHRPVWRVIQGGSQTYVDALTSPFRDRIRLRNRVVAVKRFSNGVDVTVQGCAPERFDHVVFACHSNQALRMLGSDATPLECDVLGKFPYGRNVAVLHTDTSVLPRCRRAWASWNYRLTGDDQAPASVTYNMNILQGLRSRHTFCVTLNDESRIDPARVLGRFEYEHPIFTTERSAAQERHKELLVANRTSFCGAYWRNGFHEDGVVSALRVVEAIGSLPSSDEARLLASRVLAGVER
ncbi:MAG TPA: FAD-dependent oxidoreductase [Planctomycetaceae bacterium]|nr:FAD-dependent oxidoreductase [Planctomycetaceae bacterium]